MGFFEKTFLFFTDYKKAFFTEKNINENVKNISYFRNMFLHRKCLLQIKYKSSLNVY